MTVEKRHEELMTETKEFHNEQVRQHEEQMQHNHAMLATLTAAAEFMQGINESLQAIAKALTYDSGQASAIGAIADSTRALAAADAPTEPNYRRPLAEYYTFDWELINAERIEQDAQGVSRVSWGGQVWTRRSGDGKFGRAIWFSRGLGEDTYYRLITFKDQEPAEPIPFERDTRMTEDEWNRNTGGAGDAPMPEVIAVEAANGVEITRPNSNESGDKRHFFALANQAVRQNREFTKTIGILRTQAQSQGWGWACVQLEAKMKFGS